MDANETVRALRCEQRKREKDFVGTCETNIAAMCKDTADLIESLQAQIVAKGKEIASREQSSVDQHGEVHYWRDKAKESEQRARAAEESLRRKCLDECAAVKCICDIETYLYLGSTKYIKKTINHWRNPQNTEEEKKL